MLQRFFVGVHQPCDAHRVDAAFISIHRIAKRVSGFAVGDWIMDSGAFRTLELHGGYPEPPEAYAAQIRRWSINGNLLAAVTQDYMCEGVYVLYKPMLNGHTGSTFGACHHVGPFLSLVPR